MNKARSIWGRCFYTPLTSKALISQGYCTCTLHKMAPSVCGRNLNKITHLSIKALNHLLCKSTLHLRNDLTVMARYRFDPPTHTLVSHIHTFILTIGLHSYEPLRFLIPQFNNAKAMASNCAELVLYLDVSKP